VQNETLLRIGELSRRSGVSPELLRAWERRYGLLQPTRSSGGLRLYSLEDLERVRLMREHLAGGVAAAEAATLASRAPARAERQQPSLVVEAYRRELAEALDDFDEPSAQAIIDRLLAAATVEGFLGGVVLPYLHELGERWERGEVSVAQEHFASAVLRGRLLGLARSWGNGVGPLALLACLPGEQHELGLIVFGLALRARGWRIAYLGADTPLDDVAASARSLSPALVVLAAVTDDRVRPHLAELQALARQHHLVLGGVGASPSLAEQIGASALTVDPITAADEVSTLARSDR
jgi:DNA-binding transcriptional MerR regulator